MPSARLRALTDAAPRDRAYVLYWMTALRRPHHNHALDRAVHHCATLNKPLVVLEALRVDYPWASDRLHAFVLDGMADNRAAFEAAGVRYLPYVEPAPGAGRGLLQALARRACVVVTDDYPAFFLPRMAERAADLLQEDDVLLEAVDGNGLLPMYGTERVFTVAHSFRRHLQRELPHHLTDAPAAAPFAGRDLGGADLDEQALARWPLADRRLEPGRGLRDLPIDHGVRPAALRGGFRAARAQLDDFLARRFPRYADGRNHPDDEVSSGLSPYLHFGFLSPHEVFARIVEEEAWQPSALAPKPTGRREGWWGMSAPAEAFLDQLVTWRELGFNMCAHRPDYDRWESLPAWARQTLTEHADDPRPHLYDLPAFEEAATHDELWNAAQRELRLTGRIHNYLRMLWGKKILEWSPSPQDALQTMIALNDKYALDGRDPNSYSGIGWVLGRYDRAWGPERPIFGKVRFMSSDSARRKLRVRGYLERFGAQPSLLAP